MEDFNPKCPFCGEETLQGTIELTVTNVPLEADGFSDTDSRAVTASEIVEIRCTSCDKDVPAQHYMAHGEGREDIRCDCTEQSSLTLGRVT